MKIPIVVSISRMSVAWLLLVLLMAGFVGYQAAAAMLITQQLGAAYADRRDASADLEAARATRARAQTVLERAEAILDRALREQQRAAQMSSL